MKMNRLFVIPLVVLCAMALIAADGEKKTKKEKRAASRSAHVTKDQLILVKNFSTENTEVFGDHSKNPDRVAAKKVRVPPRLTAKIIGKMKKRKRNVAAYSSELESEGAIVLDGEFLIMDNGSGYGRFATGFWGSPVKGVAVGPVAMTVQMWLCRGDDPSSRFAVTEFTALVKRGGSGRKEGPATDILARKITAYLVK